MDDTEIERLRRLGREGQKGVDADGVVITGDEDIGWKEVFLGRKTTERPSAYDDISGMFSYILFDSTSGYLVLLWSMFMTNIPRLPSLFLTRHKPLLFITDY